jgi:Ca2+-binding EF-hand superfamily protein
MDGPKTNEEKILDKYYAELPPEEEESGIKYQIKLSAEKYFEFEQAFKLVAGKDESIDREQVSEVFETLGFGFEEWHLDKYK